MQAAGSGHSLDDEGRTEPGDVHGRRRGDALAERALPGRMRRLRFSARTFAADLAQAEPRLIGSAMIGGLVVNVANILLVAAIDIAGMAVAFPVGIGLALVLGVVLNYLADPTGNARCVASAQTNTLGQRAHHPFIHRRMVW